MSTVLGFSVERYDFHETHGTVKQRKEDKALDRMTTRIANDMLKDAGIKR